MACALGALAGNAADGMQVFQRVQAEDAAAAERMIAAGQVRIELKEDVPRLWLRVTVTGSEGTGVAIVQDRHDNVAYLESDGNVLRDTRSAAEAEDAPDYGALSVETIWEFCTHRWRQRNLSRPPARSPKSPGKSSSAASASSPRPSPRNSSSAARSAQTKSKSAERRWPWSSPFFAPGGNFL